jgi:aerobic-type carbon monoxide dehydrogenase small subunit (CoxS/CutS family)
LSAPIPFSLTVNGQVREVPLPGDTPLLTVLRQDLGLKGTRFGCGEERCGACMVLVDGRPLQSCSTPLWAAEGKAVTTIEGLSAGGEPGLLQRAFLDEQAAQCGYCINGIIMSLAGLLASRPTPTRGEILQFLDERHLCRCGAHPRILRALDRALSLKAATMIEGRS